MDKIKFDKACKLLYHFGEKGFTEESIREMIPEFGKPVLTISDDMIWCISYGKYDVWVGCDGRDINDIPGTHVEVKGDDIHLVAPACNCDKVDEGLIELTESLKEFVSNGK